MKRLVSIALAVLAVGVFSSVRSFKEEGFLPPRSSFPELLLSDFSFQYELFKRSHIENGRYVYKDGKFKVTFTVDPELQSTVERVFERFRVKYGAYVAVEPETGAVLALLSSTKYPDLLFRNTFPTASTFKIITASAALETGLATPQSEMVCGGTADSCSPSVWLNSVYMRKRRFDESFANSANPFFGNLGRLLGKGVIMEFARRFGFNRKGYGFPWGKVEEPAGDYHIALLSAGLKGAHTSPLHQAFVASIVENGGVAILPNLIARIETTEGRLIYSGEPIVLGRAISRKTADALKEMMVMTVTSGTASDRRYFRLLRRKHRDLKIGGKTGTLSQWLYPEGRCEWFVGFLEHRGRKLAFASIAVNGSRYVISGYELGAVIAMRFANSNSPAHD